MTSQEMMKTTAKPGNFKMQTFISSENIHVWDNQNPFNPALLCSIEADNKKELKQFKTKDDCINWLFLNGYKQSARELNKHKE